MGLVVGHVATLRAEAQRHASVGGDREDEQQLLQVGTMVLIVAEGDRQRRPPQEAAFLGSLAVRSAEGNRGRIVVQFIQRNVELLDDMGRHGQDQRRHVGGEQPVQCPAHAIVVEPLDLLREQAQCIGSMTDGPLAHPVDRPAGNEQIAQQDQQGLDRRELRAAIFRRQSRPQKILQPHATQERIEDRHRADRGRTQNMTRRAGHGGNRRFGQRTYRLGRSRTLGGHVAWLLPGCAPTACRRRASATRHDRNRVESGCRSPQGNVQRRPEASVRARAAATYCDGPGLTDTWRSICYAADAGAFSAS